VYALALGDDGTLDALDLDNLPSPSGVVRLTATGAPDPSDGDAGLSASRRRSTCRPASDPPASSWCTSGVPPSGPLVVTIQRLLP
jgi:hypothetical protein